MIRHHKILTYLGMFCICLNSFIILKRYCTYIDDIKPSRLLVILDGFDEVKDNFKDDVQKEIRLFADSRKDVNIIISSRQNGLIGHFDGFDEYTLPKLDFHTGVYEYIVEQLQEKADSFNSLLYHYKFKDLIESPFYLVHLTQIFKETPHDFPTHRNQVFDRIIKLFNTREKESEKYNYEEWDTLEENQDLLLGKLSLTMLMMNLNVLSRKELKLLFDNDSDYNQVLKYPVIRKEGNEIDFIHNLFQENYCAKYLSTLAFEEIKKCITYAPEFEKIKPKWANTIASIFNIIDESSPLFSNLLHFILESEPSLLVRIEYDKIDLDIRLSVFKTIMQDNNRYYQTFNFSELIVFAGIKENQDVIKYILATITSHDQKLTRDLIYLLKYANPRDLFGLERDIVEKCQNILSSNEFGDDIHEEALECLDTLNLVDEEFISWLFDYRPSFNKKNVISIVFKLLTNLKLVDTYIDFFIDSIPICNEKLIRNNYTVSTGAKYNFYKGIATSKSINSIKKILNRILNIPEIESDSHDKIFCINHLESDFANPLVSLMILAYNENSSCLPEILNVMSKISSRFYGMTTFEKYKPFFETTKSTTEAFWYYWDNKHKRNFDWSIRECMNYWLDESMILQWINKYQSNYFNDDDVIQFYHELSSFPEKQAYFIDSINSFSSVLKSYFANRPAYPRLDYRAVNNDLDLVLDRNEFNKVLSEICDAVDVVTIDAIKLHRRNAGNKYHLPYDFIFNVLENNPEIGKESLCTYFTDEKLWNLFVIKFLLPKLQNNPQFLSSNHLDFLHSWCRAELPNLNFTTAVRGKKASFNRREDEYYFSQIFLHSEIELDDNILLDLISMDTSLVDDFEKRFESKHITLSQKILSLVQDKELIKKRVLDNLQNENTASIVILSHIAICKALKIKDAKGHFIRFLREDSLFPYELKRMVELFLEFNGDIRDMDFIINNFDSNNEAHWFVIEKLSSIKNYQKRINPLVLKYSTAEYDDEVQKKAMNQLIRNSQFDGLLKLLQYCEEHYYDSISHYDWAPSISKMPFNDEMILTLEEFIILIVRKVKEEPNNIRGEVSELIFTVLKSFSISVNGAFEKLHPILLKYLDINNLDMYNFNSKIKGFERHYYYNKKDISTVQEALIFIRSIHADF